MKLLNKLKIALAMLAITAASSPSAALAEYPDKNIKMIIGYSAGGGADAFVRTVGKYLPKYLGVDFDYAYHEGGGGTVSINEMLKAKDTEGYTLAVGILPHQIIPTQVGDVGYKPEDVNWMATFSIIPNGIYVASTSDIKSIDDLVAKAKEKPGKLASALPGPQSGNALFFTQFQKATGTKMPEIQYGGGSDMYKAVLSGETVTMVTNANWATRQPDELRLLAVASDKRFSLTPDVPTFKELGLDLIDVSVRAIIAPAGISEEAVKKLNDAFSKIAADPQFIEDMNKIGLAVDYRDAAATNAYVADFVKSNEAAFEALRNAAK